MKTVCYSRWIQLALACCLLGTGALRAQTTSWKGTTSTSWSTASNWTNGVPSATVDAVIGDGSFTGSFQPTISTSAATKNLTISATGSPVLTISKALTISGNLTLNAGGSISHRGVTVTVKGNWANSGAYTGTTTTSRVNFAGANQTISGTTVTAFRRVSVNAGSIVTMQSNFSTSVNLTVSGTLIPAENATPPVVSGTGTLTVAATGVLHVTAATYAANYANTGTVSLSAGSVVVYSATTKNQTVRNNLTYSTLRVSGAGFIKSLAGNLNAMNATTTATGRIEVESGALDLAGFTANRGTTVAGGAVLVFNGATLRMSASNFPVNFAGVDLRLSSTVEYYGGTQTVSSQTYGNLLLTGNTGAAVKTLPGTAFRVEGNLTSTVGTATSVSFTAASAITVNGSVSIGTSTTFNGGSFVHNIAGNLAVLGTFTGATSTIRMAGGGGVISGTGTHNYFNLTFAASNITATADAAINVAGDLADVEPGAFTHATGGTFTMTGAAKSISGPDIVFDNLVIASGASTTMGATIKVNGNMTVTGTFTGTGGTVIMSGTSKSISGSGTAVFGTLQPTGTITTASNFTINNALDVGGSFTATANTATFTATSSVRGTANLFNVTVNGTSLTMGANAVLGIAGVFAVTAGTFDVTSNIPNTVIYNGTGAQSVRAGAYHHLTIGGSATKTAAGAITVNGDMNIAAGGTFSAGSSTHTVYGNWATAGTFTAGSGTITFAGSLPSNISGTNTFANLTLAKASSTTPVNLLNNTTVSTVNMNVGWINTGSNAIIITTTRTGPGIIMGTITRQHGFTLIGGVYEFESPNNTLTITLSTLLTSVTVTVKKGPVTDFPGGASINREYTVSSTGVLNLALASMKFHYEDDELNGNTESTMNVWLNSGGSWASQGKSGNSTTDNWVSAGALTAINGRWTLSSTANIVRWNGKISSDWNTLANWSVLSGTPTRPPGVNDIVIIGDSTFLNQPVISTAVSIKGLNFASVKAATLTLSGGSLTTSGNISGSWAADAQHTINAGNQNITVNGDFLMSEGTNNRSINLNIGSGSVSVSGNVQQRGNASLIFSGTGTLTVGGNYIYTGGTFTGGSGTVVYSGSGTQNVAGVNYNHLTFQKTGGTGLLGGASVMTGDLTVNGGQFSLEGFNLSAVNVAIASGATLLGGSSTIGVTGNWSNAGTFSPGSGTVSLSGSAAQNVSASPFNHFVVNKSSGAASLTGNITLTGNLTLSAGTLALGTFTANRTATGGSMQMGAGTLLTVGGSANFPSLFSSYSLNTSSTVQFNGTVAQAVPGAITYGNLEFSNGGGAAKTLQISATVNGNITINSGSTFSGDVHTVNLYGNWINSGTYTPGSSTLTLNGTSKTITGSTTFNRITVYGSYAVDGSNCTYNGLLNITSTGSFDAGAGVATVNGDLTNSGSLTSNGTTTFTGLQLQTIRFINAVVSNSSGIVNFNGNVAPVLNSTSRPTYATLNINNTAGVTASVGWNVMVAFNISSGATFNSGNGTHNIYGTFTNNGTVTSNGTINFLPAAPGTIQLTGTSFSSNGNLVFGGTGAISVTGAPAALNNVTITNSSGVTPNANWTMNGSFLISSTGVFNAGSYTFTVGEDVESNGTLNGGTSNFTLTSTSTEGAITGSSTTTFYDVLITGTITADADYNVSHNFTNNGTYIGEPGVLTMTGALAGAIGSGTLSSFNLDYLTIRKSSGIAVTLTKPITSVTALQIESGIFDIGANAVTEDAGLLSIEDNARLIIRGNNTLPVFTDYQLDTLSTVEYAGATQTVSTATPYGNLVISAAGDKTATSILKVINNFTLTNGNFIPGAFADSIGGNWMMTGGTFTNTGNTMVFYGSGEQQLSSTGAFNNYTVKKLSGFVNLVTDLTVNGTLNFIQRNIRTSDFTVILPATGAVTNAAQGTGWVFGRLRKQVATGTGVVRSFEVGDSLIYAPASLTIASVSTAGSVTARTIGTDISGLSLSGMDAAKSVNRYWAFENGGTVFTNTSATLNWNATDIDAGVVTANLKGVNVVGATRTLPPVTSVTATSISLSGITELGMLAVAELIAAINWTGNLSTNWYTNGNWSTGVVPVQTSNVVIPTGRPNYPDVTTGTALTNDLTIQSGATVIVTTGLLKVSGVLANSGTFTVSDGSLELNGTTAQTIPASVFAGNEIRNLTINNPAGVTLGGTLLVNGILKATTGTLAAGNFLTLGSTAVRTALIDGAGGGQVTGTVTMQRYLPSGFGYKYFASPFQSATVNELADEVNLAATFPELYSYDENKTTSGWTAYTTTSNPLTSMRGYAANLGVSTSPVTADMSGTVTNASVSLTLLNNNRVYTKGFHLVGNPYPSPIDWDAVTGWTRTNIDNAVYYFNAGTVDRYVGTYSSYINGISSDGVANGIVPSMQGFFIHVSDGAYPVTGTLTATNAVRVNDLAPVFHRRPPPVEPLFRFSAGFADDGFPQDPAVLYFDDHATKGYDEEMDALKMRNTDARVPNLIMEGPGGRELSICAWPNRTDLTDTLPLRIVAERAGMLTFRTEALERMPASRRIYLYDSSARRTTEMIMGAQYRTDVSAGDHRNRFFLVFGPRNATGGGDDNLAGEFSAWSNGGQLYGSFAHVEGDRCTVTVSGITGQLLFRKELSGSGRHSLGSGYSAGMYIVTFHAGHQKETRKVIIQK